MSKHKKYKKKKNNIKLPEAPEFKRVSELYMGGCNTYVICILFIISSIVLCAATTFI